MFLAEAGAHPVGLDLSEQQLASARGLMTTPYPLVHGDGERLPFRDASFDVVLSDHGAISWADPYKTVPEVARVLRSGGRFAFNTSTPWVYVCHPGGDGPPRSGWSTPTSASTAWTKKTALAPSCFTPPARTR